MSKLQTITDFFAWLLFIGTAFGTVLFIFTSAYYTITEPTLSSLIPLIGATVTGLLHAGLRFIPSK